MSTHFIPIKPAPALPKVCSYNSPTPSLTMLGFSTMNLINNLTVYERNLLLKPPHIVTIPLDELLNPRKNRFRKNSPPRPQNAWVIFRKDFENRLRTQHPNLLHSVNEISKMASEHWSKMPEVVKLYFKVLSKLARLRHKDAFPGYRYKPKGKSETWLFKNINKSAFVGNGNNNRIAYGDHGNNDTCYRLDESAIIEQQHNQRLENNVNLHINSISEDVECDSMFVDTGVEDVCQNEASNCDTIHRTIYPEHCYNTNPFWFAISQWPAQMFAQTPPQEYFYSLPANINIMGLNGKLIK